MTQLRIIAMFLLLVAGCLKKSNPNYCPGLNPDNNCTEGDGGVSCVQNDQCPAATPVCDMQSKVCVQCTPQSSACKDDTPVCGADQRCHACRSHEECTSNACLPNGSCADAADVAYVGTPQASDNSVCAANMPCTKIMKALDTMRPYVKLAGTIDEVVVIDTRSVTILSEPGSVLTRTTGGGMDILVIMGASNVRILDLEIKGASGANAGVSLPGGNPSVTLDRVSIHDHIGGGVVVVSGMINIYRSKIFNNVAGGISIAAAQFDVQNNFITVNGSAQSQYGGVSLNFDPTAGTHTLAFNTISSNTAKTGSAPGVTCTASAAFTFSNNIIYGNTTLTNQVDEGACVWTYSDIGPVSVGSNLNTDPMFLGGGDYHLKNGSPVIDKADPSAVLDIDVDGDFRPNGRRRDIGADEYRAIPAARASTTPSP